MTVPDVISRTALMNSGLPSLDSDLQESSGYRFKSASSYHSVRHQENQNILRPLAISVLPLNRPLSHESTQSSSSTLHQRMLHKSNDLKGSLSGAEKTDIIRQALNLNRFKVVPQVETKPNDSINDAWEGDDYQHELSDVNETGVKEEDDSWSTSTRSKKKKKKKKRSKSAKSKKSFKKFTNKVGIANQHSLNENNAHNEGLTLGIFAAAAPVTKKTPQISITQQIKKPVEKPQLSTAQEHTGKNNEKYSSNLNEKIPHLSLSLQKLTVHSGASPRLSKSQNNTTYNCSNSTILTRSQDNHSSTGTQDKLKVMKVYLSDRQSNSIKLLGLDLPCAPPVTPMPDELCHYEYIPSLADVRSQRALKVRLGTLEKRASQKKAKQLAEQLKQEQQNHKDQQIELKKLQRLQIYALNKVMTEFENKNFEEFCRTKGLNTSNKKSNK